VNDQNNSNIIETDVYVTGTVNQRGTRAWRQKCICAPYLQKQQGCEVKIVDKAHLVNYAHSESID